MNDRETAAILAQIVSRISEGHPRPAIFEQNEISEWSLPVVDQLLKVGLLYRGKDATSVICPGCEEQCLRPVIKRKPARARKAKALVTCDLRSDTSTVPIPIEQLRRWHSDLGALASFIADQIGSAIREPPIGTDRISLGTVKGERGFLRLALNAGDDISLSVGRQTLPIDKAIIFGRAGISLDVDAIQKLANMQRAGDVEQQGAKPLAGQTNERKQGTQKKYERWRISYLRMKRENPSWSDEAICHEIAEGEPAPKPSPRYVRRRLYPD